MLHRGRRGGEAEVGGRLPHYVVAMVGQDWKITYDGRGSLDEGVAWGHAFFFFFCSTRDVTCVCTFKEYWRL